MNIVLDKYNFNKNNMFFMDTRKNMVLDGNFTKLIYSDFSFTMNALYIMYPIFRYYIDKNILYFQLNDVNNENINWFSSLEQHILNTYCKENNVSKHKLHLLNSQIITGKIKIYRNDIHSAQSVSLVGVTSGSEQTNYIILKISGVWENTHNVGITYKFIYPT
jgi:hypothetical protein